MVQNKASRLMFSLVVSALLLTLSLSQATEDKRGAQTKATVVYQSFDWNALSDRAALYPSISSLAPSLSQAGLTHVWFPPPSQSADQQGYMPGEWYNILASGALKSAIGAVKGAGMQAVCDIVINHRTATYKSPCDSNWNNFTQPNWGTWAVVKNDYMCNSASTFCQSSCSCGNADTGQNFCGAPDVDHTNSQVQKDVGSWLGWLKSEYGFSGWRFDMVVGYAGSYVGQYVAGSNPSFSVGEYWDDDTSHVTQWIVSTGYRSTAFDFPNRDTLKAAVDSNDFSSLLQGISPPGVMGQMPLYSSTFTDNHDTARNDRFGTTTQIIMGYAYILSHPGTPFVFADDWGTGEVQSAIKKMIGMRNQQGLTPSSSLYVDQHTKGLYSVYLGGATALCGGNTALKLGTSSWSPCGNNWSLFTSGTNYALWVR